jgi:uncharacterized protein with von Willebrand factor type A (vWA) domain
MSAYEHAISTLAGFMRSASDTNAPKDFVPADAETESGRAALDAHRAARRFGSFTELFHAVFSAADDVALAAEISGAKDVGARAAESMRSWSREVMLKFYPDDERGVYLRPMELHAWMGRGGEIIHQLQALSRNSPTQAPAAALAITPKDFSEISGITLPNAYRRRLNAPLTRQLAEEIAERRRPRHVDGRSKVKARVSTWFCKGCGETIVTHGSDRPKCPKGCTSGYDPAT